MAYIARLKWLRCMQNSHFIDTALLADGSLCDFKFVSLSAQSKDLSTAVVRSTSYGRQSRMH